MRIYLNCILITIFILCCNKLYSQTKVFGGTKRDFGYGIAKVANDKFIAVGNSLSSNGDFNTNAGLSDGFILFLDDSLRTTQLFSVGGNGDDGFTCVTQVQGGGYMVGGITSSQSIMNQCGAHSIADYWVQMYDSANNLMWQKCYGGSANDFLYQIIQTQDGNFILGGESYSNDGDVIGNHSSNEDIWLIKIDRSGNILWSKCYGSGYDEFYSKMVETSSGAIAVCASAVSSGGDIPYHYGGADIWIFTIDQYGTLLWSKSYGGTSDDAAGGICTTGNGELLVVGETTSNDFDVQSFNHGNKDVWILKVDSDGVLLNEKCLGGSGPESAAQIVPNRNGSFYITGYTSSLDGDVISRHPLDFWCFSIDSSFNILTNQTFGGNNLDVPFDICATDSGFISIGYTRSDDDDAIGLHTDSVCLNDNWCADIFIVKSNPNNINSIPDLDHKKYTVLGNYKNSIINISLSDFVTGLEYRIYTISGKLIFSGQEAKTLEKEFSLPCTLMPGIYIVNLKCREFTQPINIKLNAY